MRKGFVFLMMGALLFAASCSSGGDCTPHEGKYCDEGTTYWMDSCGNLEEVFQNCPCECEADHSACKTECGCVPQCSGRCCGSDQCGSTCPDTCANSGQTCNTSTCQCEGTCQPRTCIQLGKECDWWDDGCGTDIPCGVCTGGKTCNANGQCVGGTVTCPGGLTLCGRECVDTSEDPRHCGACNNACPAGQVCQSSQCTTWDDCRQTTCPGFSYCDLNTGECKPGCAGDGQCYTNETCELATHDCVCIQGYDRCEGQCVSTSSPADHPCSPGYYCDFSSGQCLQGCSFDSQCGTNESCQNNVCSCIQNHHRCSGNCVSDNSIDHCGTGCLPCQPPMNSTATCDGTSCGHICDHGYHDCGGFCVDDTSPLHCGTQCTPCQAPAHATATCDGTNCGWECIQGYVPCDTDCCEHCDTAGCTGFNWCNQETGLCEEGCTLHDQCNYGYYCWLTEHECTRIADSSCPSGYVERWTCSDWTRCCVHSGLPADTEYVFADVCPEGTTERSYCYCSDYTYICIPND
jgi:hypothetical protein